MVLYAVGICCYTIIPPICTAALFGTKYYGEIYGFINFGVMAGGAIGSPVVASIYDITHSYELAWIACIVSCALGTILILLSDYMFKHFLRKMDEEHAQA